MEVTTKISSPSFGEFVDALTALNLVAVNNPDVRITVLCEDERLQILADSYWLNKKRNKRPRPDIVIDIESNREECDAFEVDYRRRLVEQIDIAAEEVATKHGVSIEQIEKPRGYNLLKTEEPFWHRMNGYMVSMFKHVDLSRLMYPFGARVPYEVPIPKNLKDYTNRMLHASRNIIKPGMPYLVVTHAEMLEEAGLKLPYPSSWAIAQMQPDADPIQTLGLIHNSRCMGVVSKVGEYGRAAAVTKIRFIAELTENIDLQRWEWTSTPHTAAIDLKHETVTQETFHTDLNLVYHNSFGFKLPLQESPPSDC